MAEKFETHKVPNLEAVEPRILELVGLPELTSQQRLEVARLIVPEVPIAFRESDPTTSIGSKKGIFLSSMNTDRSEKLMPLFDDANSGLAVHLMRCLSMHLSVSRRQNGEKPAPKTHSTIASILTELAMGRVGSDESDEVLNELHDLVLAAHNGEVEPAEQTFHDLLFVSERLTALYKLTDTTQ